MVQPVGGAPVRIDTLTGSPVAAAVGRDGTTALAWGSGRRRLQVMVAVAEGGR